MGKVPVTRREKPPKGLKSNKIISKYHAKINEVGSHESDDLKKMGGFESYQNASLYGTKHGDTSKWLLKELKPLILEKIQPGTPKLRLLDVGALEHNYTHIKWIETEAIDLHPRIPGVKRMDFLEYPSSNCKDLVALSLVLNFVGDPHDRGRMLRVAHKVLVEDGHLYVVLPRACIDHSRFMTLEYFTQLCEQAGFERLSHHLSKKLAYFLFKKTNPTSFHLVQPTLTAAGFNNFKIRH